MSMTPSGATLQRLRRERPEWGPWLAVLERIVRETPGSTWDAAVPSVPKLRPGVPLLAGAEIALRARSVRDLLEELIRIAARRGTPSIATLHMVLPANPDVLMLFSASISNQGDRVREVARACGADPQALEAIAGLLAVPFLQACYRRWSSAMSESWVEGYCPLCGSWPAFAEVRGIERTRCFRCSRCGAAWHPRAPQCPYCDMDDRQSLVSLVPERGGPRGVIDACTRCLGYVKTFTRLQGCPPANVMLEDLATVDLDVAALEQGYRWPGGTGCPLSVTVTDSGESHGLFPWNS